MAANDFKTRSKHARDDAPRGKHVHALVVAPTRELAHQIHDAAKPLLSDTALTLRLLTSGMSEHGARGRHQQAVHGSRCSPALHHISLHADIVVCTPGRFLRELRMSERFAASLSGTQVAVLDEADRLLEMGFRNEVESVLAALPSHKCVNTVCR